jgi:hypothetical protein
VFLEEVSGKPIRLILACFALMRIIRICGLLRDELLICAVGVASYVADFTILELVILHIRNGKSLLGGARGDAV